MYRGLTRGLVTFELGLCPVRVNRMFVDDERATRLYFTSYATRRLSAWRKSGTTGTVRHLSSTKHRLSGRRSPDCRRVMYVDKYVFVSCALSIEPTHTKDAANLMCVYV